ncbi:hypothetical protein J6590_102494, partial [Homalodisca vitripennis]
VQHTVPQAAMFWCDVCRFKEFHSYLSGRSQCVQVQANFQIKLKFIKECLSDLF